MRPEIAEARAFVAKRALKHEAFFTERSSWSRAGAGGSLSGDYSHSSPSPRIRVVGRPPSMEPSEVAVPHGSCNCNRRPSVAAGRPPDRGRPMKSRARALDRNPPGESALRIAFNNHCDMIVG